MKRKPALLLALSLSSVPPSIAALGLGDIELRSSLNQPLEARIALKSWRPGELEDLKVNLAGREHFDRAGMDRMPSLTELAFQVVESSDGSAYIEVSTPTDFKEPFLDFLIEVSWPQGRVLREYTLLLDPPLYAAAVAESLKRPLVKPAAVQGSGGEIPSKSPEQSIEQTAATVGAPSGHRSAEKSQHARHGASSRAPSADTAPVRAEVNQALTYGPTAAGDTLWEVASELTDGSPEELNQLMLALFRTNPEAFLEDNMNLLKKGMVLRIPDEASIAAIGTREALDEVRRHHALWEEYRQTVAARTGNLPSGALASTGASSDVQGQKAATVAGERVKLVSAGSANSGPGVGVVAADDAEGLRRELELASEDAEATKRENQDLRERLGEAETIIQDLRRLIQLKDDAISSLQHQLATANSDFEAPTPESAGELEDDALVGPAGNASAAEGTLSAESLGASTVQATIDLASNTSGRGLASAGETSQGVGIEEGQPLPLVPSEANADQELVIAGPSASASISSEELVQPAAASDHSVAIGLGLFGGLLVAGSGFAIWRRRRAKASSSTIADGLLPEGGAASLDGSGSVAADADDREPTEADAAEGVVGSAESQADEVDETLSSGPDPLEEDPLAEVNVYLAYERFEQAEQLVKEAIANYPSRQEYKLKLLEIFAASKNTAGFELHARALHDAVGDDNPLMEKALAWWRELCPDRDLFAEDDSEQAVIATENEDAQADASLEMPDYVQEPDELPVGSDTVHLKPGERTASDDLAASEMDLDFDLSSGLTGEEAAPDRAEGTVDFDLGFEAGATEDDSQQRGELDFGLGTSAPTSRESEHTQGAAAALDLDLNGDAPYSSGATEGTVDFDLASLGLEESPSSSMDDVADESGSDETIDLDYSLGDIKEGQLADELEPLEFNEISQEGTVDFDLGLAGIDETPGTESVETSDAIMSRQTQLGEGRAEDTIEQGVTHESLAAKADPASDDELNALALGDVDYQDNASPEHEKTPGTFGLGGDSSEALGVDLELEFEEFSPSEENHPAVEAGGDSEKTSGTETTQSLSQEKVLDQWADFEGQSGDEVDRTLVLGKEFSQDLDEIQTKLELAQAYIDMGDAEGARSILDEVISEGDDDQKQAAKDLIERMA